MLNFYLALFEGSTKVGHLYSALVPRLSLNSMFNFTLELPYIQLKQHDWKGGLEGGWMTENGKHAIETDYKWAP